MKIEVHNSCTDFKSYRAERVKSLFNAESGANFDLTAELPLEGLEWSLGRHRIGVEFARWQAWQALVAREGPEPVFSPALPFRRRRDAKDLVVGLEQHPERRLTEGALSAEVDFHAGGPM